MKLVFLVMVAANTRILSLVKIRDPEDQNMVAIWAFVYLAFLLVLTAYFLFVY